MASKRRNSFYFLFRLVLFAMLGALMYASKWALQMLPNIHLIGFFIISFTVVYRFQAIFPIYVFVFLCGVFDGFGTWWVPYLYIWTILWAVTLLIPKKLAHSKWGYLIFPVLGGIYGLCFGTLYTPVYALLMGFDLPAAIAWIAKGFVFDIYHCIGNVASALLVPFFIKLLTRLEKMYS